MPSYKFYLYKNRNTGWPQLTHPQRNEHRGARLRNVPNTDDSAHKRQRRALPGQRPEAKNNDLGSVD
jgi:hypothetical protein